MEKVKGEKSFVQSMSVEPTGQVKEHKERSVVRRVHPQEINVMELVSTSQAYIAAVRKEKRKENPTIIPPAVRTREIDMTGTDIDDEFIVDIDKINTDMLNQNMKIDIRTDELPLLDTPTDIEYSDWDPVVLERVRAEAYRKAELLHEKLHVHHGRNKNCEALLDKCFPLHAHSATLPKPKSADWLRVLQGKRIIFMGDSVLRDVFLHMVRTNIDH